MIRSIATVTLGGRLPEKFAAIAAAGFRHIELTHSDLQGFDGTAHDIKQLADSFGLRILVFQPLRDFEGRPREQLRHHLERAEQMLETTRTLGAETLMLCSNVAEDGDDDEELLVADLRTLAGRAADAGINVGYEALSWGRFASLYRDAWRLVDLVDRANFGLVLDTFHSLALDDDLSLLQTIPAERIFLIQVADAPRLSCEIIEWSRHHRCLPGEGEFDLQRFLAIPMRNGYRGPVSLEVFSDQHSSEPPLAVAKQAYRSLSTLEYETRKGLRGRPRTSTRRDWQRQAA
jgi:4-hydroxyphenylpyruvate dioxygenase